MRRLRLQRLNNGPGTALLHLQGRCLFNPEKKMMMMPRNKIDMSMIVPTSKMSLKLSCLAACGNDIERATQLYQFMTADLQDLPDVDPVRPSGMERVMASADGILGWIGGHQAEIIQGIGIIRGLAQNTTAGAAAQVANVAPIPDTI